MISKAQIDKLARMWWTLGLDHVAREPCWARNDHMEGPETGRTQPVNLLPVETAIPQITELFWCHCLGIRPEVEHVLLPKPSGKSKPKKMLVEFVGTPTKVIHSKDILVFDSATVACELAMSVSIGEYTDRLTMKNAAHLVICRSSLDSKWGS